MMNAKYKDREWLREQYIKKDLTQQEIADKTDVTQKTVSEWLRKTGVRQLSTHPTVGVNHNGYVVCDTSVCGERVHVRMSRLLAALTVDDLSELEGKHVHHKNRIPWDDRTDNIETVEPDDHTRIHHWELSWTDRIAIAEQYKNTTSTIRDLAGVWDVDNSTIHRVVNRDVCFQ